MITWKPTTEERYDEMLCVLPPTALASGNAAFLVGEAYDSDTTTGQPTFQAFNRVGEEYFQSERAVTFAEFKAEFPQAEYY